MNLNDYLKTTEASIYEKACPVNDVDCFFLCQGYHRWAASRGEGSLGAFVTHCNISCSGMRITLTHFILRCNICYQFPY